MLLPEAVSFLKAMVFVFLGDLAFLALDALELDDLSLETDTLLVSICVLAVLRVLLAAATQIAIRMTKTTTETEIIGIYRRSLSFRSSTFR